MHEHRLDYDKAGAIVVGVSPDEPERLRKFADKYGLAFTLLADPEHAVAEAYGVWIEKSMYGRRYWGIAAGDVRHRRRRHRASVLRKA